MSTMAVSADLPWQELHGNLRAFIGKRVRNDADVDDLVQRVLLQIVEGVGPCAMPNDSMPGSTAPPAM